MSTTATATAQSRLVEAIEHASGGPANTGTITAIRGISMTDPNALGEVLKGVLPGRFSLTGSLDRRLLLADRVDSRGWTAADLSGQPHATRVWPQWTFGRLQIDTHNDWLSTATLTEDGVHRLLHPRVLLVALYHPEWFPLPRFPLGISDLARAVRSTLLGQVRLMDMQLGVTLADILATVESWQPEIIGISATFGQHDLMADLLDHVGRLPHPPVVLAGGSLTARNEHILLDRYPKLLVARGAGEPTMIDVVGLFHGDLELAEVRGIGYAGAPQGQTLTIGRPHRRTAGVSNRAQHDFLPELDLLDATFRHRGVVQLEASRGCTNFCSFCPRGHKGTWAGGNPEDLRWILAEIRQVFERHPGLSRTLYLVDEEVIGASPDAVPRVLTLAKTVHSAGFRWESSCRIDQVVDSTKEQEWHVERATMWRQLVATGLRRMLFGVESGVTSILDRFNKETTAEQNVLAIRTLSALGVPTRFTYITFDHLMTIDELHATHDFQARRDLLLHPLPELTVEEIVEGVRDERFVAEHGTHRPFYSAISYMLVSMECLIGAAYTRRVQAAGLALDSEPSMGRVDAGFSDWRIGRCSYFAQMWVDRNFALDYTLKSLEKILDGRPRHLVRGARVVLKEAAFALLTRMLAEIDRTPLSGSDVEGFDDVVQAMMDEQLVRLAEAMSVTVEDLVPGLPDSAAGMLVAQHRQWERPQDWRLINSADPCGT